MPIEVAYWILVWFGALLIFRPAWFERLIHPKRKLTDEEIWSIAYRHGVDYAVFEPVIENEYEDGTRTETYYMPEVMN